MWFRHSRLTPTDVPAPSSTQEDADGALRHSTEKFKTAVATAEVNMRAAGAVKHQRLLNNIGPNLANAIGRYR